ADVVDGRDVGVVQDPRSARLLLEPPQPVRIGREGGRQHLNRDLAPEPRIPRPVHLSHAARTQRREDLVRSQAGTLGERHGSGRDFKPRPATAPRKSGRHAPEGDCSRTSSSGWLTTSSKPTISATPSSASCPTSWTTGEVRSVLRDNRANPVRRQEIAS